MGVGEREAGDGFFDAADQGVSLISQRDFNARGPQQLQVAIEAANVQMKSPDERASCLRAGA
jgi:hypothetical protein